MSNERVYNGSLMVNVNGNLSGATISTMTDNGYTQASDFNNSKNANGFRTLALNNLNQEVLEALKEDTAVNGQKTDSKNNNDIIDEAIQRIGRSTRVTSGIARIWHNYTTTSYRELTRQQEKQEQEEKEGKKKRKHRDSSSERG